MITKYKTLLNNGKPELVKEKGYQYDSELSNPMRIAAALNDCFDLNRETEEHVYVLCFNSKLRCIGVMEASHGLVNTSLFSPREILMKALLCGSCSLAVAHNHPSGDPTPSEQDMEATKRIKAACEVVGIQFLDHIIVAGDRYYSFHEQKGE